jgi:hypothetical protein
MMIRTNSWVFIHIPKTSGTNFIVNSKKNCIDLVDCYSKYHYHFKHQPLWWWENQKLINPSDYIFSIVRNPYDRFVSFYNHIKSNIEVPDFEDFVRSDYLIKINEYIERDVGHLANLVVWKTEWPQINYIKSNINNKVNVYKIETDLKSLENYVGYQFSHTFHNQRNHKHWYQYYNNYTLDAIYNLYKEDFLSFEYKRKYDGV